MYSSSNCTGIIIHVFDLLVQYVVHQKSLRINKKSLCKTLNVWLLSANPPIAVLKPCFKILWCVIFRRKNNPRFESHRPWHPIYSHAWSGAKFFASSSIVNRVVAQIWSKTLHARTRTHVRNMLSWQGADNTHTCDAETKRTAKSKFTDLPTVASADWCLYNFRQHLAKILWWCAHK